MPKFDYIDGEYIAVNCTFEERTIFSGKGWIFSKRHRKWCTTKDNNARPIKKYAIGNALERIDGLEAIEKALVADSWAEDTDTEFPVPMGLAYMPFQKAGIEYAIKRKRVLIADAPGLGKTVQAVGIHNALNTKRVLIVCPASLKVNWSREWKKWDVHGASVGIAMSIPKREKTEFGYKTTTIHDWPNTDVVIINYDMLLTFDTQIKAITWDQVVCDEAHNLKTRTTVRSKCVFGGVIPAKKLDGKVVERQKRLEKITYNRIEFLTGTPILSKPSELWTIIQACDPRGLGADWNKFINEYCGAYATDFGIDFSGATNTDKLNRILRERFMVRRDKKAVLKDLPDKTREIVLLPQDKLEAALKKEKTAVESALDAFESMLGLNPEDRQFNYIKKIEEIADKISKNMDNQNSEEPDWEKAIKDLAEPDRIMFTELAAAREEVALAKVPQVAERVRYLVECGEPIILFAYHKSVIDALRTKLKDLRVGVITGSVSPNKRQAVVDLFQDGELDIIIGNIIAMGVGFTLTRGRIVVFAELDWVPALIEQAEDRAWRNGQKNAVLVLYIMVEGSIEATMAQRIIEKMKIIKEVLDNR